MSEIIRYGAYLPRYRAPLKDIQSFYGRPGRPRSKSLCTPALDEDTLTMAYEAAVGALAGAEAPGTVITVSQSPPFGLRKLSATLARTLGLDDAVPLDVGGHPRRAARCAGDRRLSRRRGRAAGARGGLRSPGEHRRARLRHALGRCRRRVPGRRRSGGFARLGTTARASREVYDVWRLGTEAEARYRLEVLFDAYGSTTKQALAGLATATERATADYASVCASQPHPQTLRGLGKAGVGAEQLEHTSFVGEIGNLGAASVGVALALGLDRAQPGEHLIALGYGGGEAIAQDIEVTAAPHGVRRRRADRR